MADAVADTGEPALRVWTPHRQVVFGRRDRRSDGYDRAGEAARRQDFAVREREVGGRAVAYTGTTVAFALAEPVDDHRTGIGARYDRALDAPRRLSPTAASTPNAANRRTRSARGATRYRQRTARSPASPSASDRTSPSSRAWSS